MNYSEKTIQNKIIKDLKAKGYWVMKTQGGVAGTPIGTPDILACDAFGVFFCIEVKKIGGKISAEQQAQIGRLTMNNAVVYVTNDKDFVKKLHETDVYTPMKQVYDQPIKFDFKKTRTIEINRIGATEVDYD